MLNLLLEYLFMKNKKDKKNHKGMEKFKVAIFLVLEEHPNLENILNVIIATRLATCNTPKYTLAVFDMFRVFCKHNLNVS